MREDQAYLPYAASLLGEAIFSEEVEKEKVLPPTPGNALYHYLMKVLKERGVME
jgi:hypothetical protein